MSFIKSIFEKVRRHPKRIVFPEGNDERVLRTAVEFHAMGLGAAILLGSRHAIHKRAQNLKLNLDRVLIIDPSLADDLEQFANVFATLQKEKGLGKDEALAAVKQPVYFATMMLHEGSADGVVAGLHTSVAGLLRPLFQCIRLEPGVKTASSCALIQLENDRLGTDGVLFFADCGILPDPTADQLADIAVTSAKLARQLHGTKPRVAFLSYSTKGSARHRTLERTLAAVALARQKAEERHVEADFDGELQADAALLPKRIELKIAHGSVAGRANVLIFPDLNAGNIGFKLVQSLTQSQVYGPFLNGLSKPASDLSRNSTEKEVLGSAAIVALQAVEYRKLYPSTDHASEERFVY